MRGEHQAHSIVLDVRRHRHFAYQLLQLQQDRAVQHLVDFRFCPFGRAIEHFGQFSGAGIIHQQFEKETVELRFGQRVGPFLIDGVLRGEHEERLGELAEFSGGSDLFLLHRFEQR